VPDKPEGDQANEDEDRAELLHDVKRVRVVLA
jgi:hypothetical protein